MITFADMTRATSRSVTPEQAVAEMRAAGFEPEEPFQGSTIPWRSRCIECGQPRQPKLNGIRRGVRCKHQRPLTEAEAVKEMREAGYEPLRPYPGRSDISWRARCLVCEQIRAPRLVQIRTGIRCAHTWDPKVAEAAMRELGYNPVEPYPGGVDKRWRIQCAACGHVRPSCLTAVRRGVRCDRCRTRSRPD